MRSRILQANRHANKLLQRQITSKPTPRSSSPASSFHTPPPDYEREFEEDVQEEREAYNTLVDEGGIPSYPVDLVFDVFDKNPGEYEDIVSYWESRRGGGHNSIFQTQLREWRKFRDYQLRVRRYFLERDKFPEYQQRVHDRRRRHGLEGDVEILPDRDQQSKLANWMEYQDIKYQGIEDFEKSIERAHQKVESTQKALEEAGLPGYEGVFDPTSFANHYGLCVESNNEETRALRKRIMVERDLKLAEKRLKVAQSDDLGDTVERAVWIGLFLKDVHSARITLDEVPPISVCEIENWHEEGKSHRPAPEEKEEWGRWWEVENKRRDASTRRWDAELKAEQELEFAEAGLKAAQSDGFGETIDRADLIRLVEKEVQSVRPRLDEARKSEGEIRLRGKVLGALCGVANIKRKFELHKVLVEWIERQRRAMASERATSTQHTETDGNQGQVKRTRSKTLRPSGSPNGSGSKGKRRTTRSVFSPIDPTKVSKVGQRYGRRQPKQKLSQSTSLLIESHSNDRAQRTTSTRGTGKRSGLTRQTQTIPSHASQPAEKVTIDRSNPQRSSKRISKAKDNMPARGLESTSLGPIHASRVSKARRNAGGLQTNDLHVNVTKLPQIINRRRNQKGKPSASSAGARLAQQPTPPDTPPRRSTRTSKKPQRFCPG